MKSLLAKNNSLHNAVTEKANTYPSSSTGSVLIQVVWLSCVLLDSIGFKHNQSKCPHLSCHLDNKKVSALFHPLTSLPCTPAGSHFLDFNDNGSQTTCAVSVNRKRVSILNRKWEKNSKIRSLLYLVNKQDKFNKEISVFAPLKTNLWQLLSGKPI